MHTPHTAPAPAAPRTDHAAPPSAAAPAPSVPQKIDARAFLTKFADWQRKIVAPVIPFITRNEDLTLRESRFV